MCLLTLPSPTHPNMLIHGESVLVFFFTVVMLCCRLWLVKTAWKVKWLLPFSAATTQKHDKIKDHVSAFSNLQRHAGTNMSSHCNCNLEFLFCSSRYKNNFSLQQTDKKWTKKALDDEEILQEGHPFPLCLKAVPITIERLQIKVITTSYPERIYFLIPLYWHGGDSVSTGTFWFLVETALRPKMLGVLFLFLPGLHVDGLMTVPLGFLAHFLMARYTLWWEIPGVGILTELSTVWWNPRPL